MVSGKLNFNMVNKGDQLNAYLVGEIGQLAEIKFAYGLTVFCFGL